MRARSLFAAWALVALVAGPLAFAAPGSALAAGVEWGAQTARSTYGELIAFRQAATVPAGYRRVEILLDFPGTDGPYVVDVGRVATDTSTILSFDYDTSVAHVYPNTRVGARWRVTLADGTTELGPRTTVTYADTGFPWRTKESGIVRVHWYEGDDAFAERVLASAAKGIDKASKLLGVAETDPVDVFVYASQEAFSATAGPGTREWAGAFALPDTRTLFALITPDEISTDVAYVVNDYIPHELTHLVFDTAVKNPYHYPPRWLNEGLAVYLSLGYGPSDRKVLRSGVADGRIMPLDALTNQFPTTDLQGYLAYAESVSAVSYIVDTYGQEALAGLIRSYAGGVSDDEAFRTGLGASFAEVEAGWLASIGAAEPERAGPVAAPPGPVPSDWTAQAGQGGSAAAPSAEPTRSGTPGATGTATAAPSGGATDTGSGRSDLGGVLVAVALFLAAVALGAALAIRSHGRRRPPPTAPPDISEPSANIAADTSSTSAAGAPVRATAAAPPDAGDRHPAEPAVAPTSLTPPTEPTPAAPAPVSMAEPEAAQDSPA